jgi:hypothetical protein
MPPSEITIRQVERWRETLVANLAAGNPNVDADHLNIAVQRIIERVLFLRMAEERGLQRPGQLLALCKQPDSFARFQSVLCRRAAEVYHCGLFHEDDPPAIAGGPDRFPPGLTLDDDVFREWIESLYSADCSPFGAQVLPVEILGTVYERFLGKEIRLTAESQATIVKKTAISKAAGVYYTPPCIVDHIMKLTVGRLIEGRSPNQLAGRAGRPPLRVLDMACGSGAFLLGAYRCLLDHCLAWYLENKPAAHPRAVCRDSHTGEWRLTVEQRKSLLITQLFGVDIDPRAVEVTKLSLLLKLFEGENAASTGRGSEASGCDVICARPGECFRDAALPDLSANIRCGNALIGPEYHTASRCADPQTQRRINAFDWHVAFAEIMQSGGFHAVIGNPPYVNARILFQQQGQEVKRYLGQRYRTARGGYDLYVLFVEKSLELAQQGGRCGMILPNKVASLDYAEACRAMLLEETTIQQITDVSGLRVFPGAGVYPYVLVWEKAVPDTRHSITVLQARNEQDLCSGNEVRRLRQRDLSASGGFAIHGSLDVETRVATRPLGQRAELHSGTTGFAAARMAEALCERATVGGGEYFEFIVSGNIDRYAIRFGEVRFMNRTFTRPVLAADRPHLTETKRRLFREPKLVVAGMTKRLEAALDAAGGVALGVSVYAARRLADDPRYLLGVLNSSLLSYLFRIRFQAKHLAGGFLAVNKGQLAKLPIRVIDFSLAEDRRRHDQIVELSDQMLALVRRREAVASNQPDIVLQQHIQAVDRCIDELVCELYRLTDAEVRMVEQSAAVVMS